jgi:hypothetical protein
MLSSSFSPMPFTLRSSSGLLNGAFARCSTMACAFAGPMPGSVASSAAEAVFRFTRASGPASAALAAAPSSRSPQRSPTAAFLDRFIPASSWRLCGRRTAGTDRKPRTSGGSERTSAPREPLPRGL